MSKEINNSDFGESNHFDLKDINRIIEGKNNNICNSILADYVTQFNNSVQKQTERTQLLNAELIATREASREYALQRQAELNAEAYTRALRTSPFLFDNIVAALSSLCGNPTYNSTTNEDSLNDYVRDILGHDLQVRDQTRQGLSSNSSSAERGHAGEIDIQIRNNGKPIGIYEGLRLDGIDKKEIFNHIIKATINYNPQGVKEVFVVAYVRNQDRLFGDFWNKYMDCAKEYKASFPEYEIYWDEVEEDTGLSAVRSIRGIYNIDGVEHNVHLMAVKLMR